MHPLRVYRASAGSGKTFTLAVEYIKLLVMAEGGGEYAHILGVTFTNKATTEMKDRIIGQLYGIAHALPTSDDYMAALRSALKTEPSAPQGDDEIRRRCALALRQILHDYSNFRVQTIDAFFQNVLRGLAHELGLTANLQVEISDTEVLSEAVDRIIDRLHAEPVVLEWMKSLVRDQIENNQRWDVTSQVKAFGRTIFNEDFQLRGEALRRFLADETAFRAALNAIADEAVQATDAVKVWSQRIDDIVRDEGVDITEFSNSRILITLLQRLHDGALSDIAVNATIQKWAGDGATLVKTADRKRRPDLMHAADRISSVLAEMVEQLPAEQRRYNSSRLASAHIKPLRLLDFIDREVTQINSETSRFNLAKTPILLRQMIGDNDAPFIFEKIGARLHHIMIDEFQDTSRLQWENFKPLLAECRSHGGRNLVVGDVKQSIYRFRGGDWRTLADIQDTVTPTPLVVPMSVNFRSERNIVDFNTAFFTTAVALMDEVSAEEEAMTSHFSFAAAYHHHAQVASPARQRRAALGYVRATVVDSTVAKTLDVQQDVILDDLCHQVVLLHEQGVPYSDMTILVRWNRECQVIIDAFASHPDMPPIVSDEAFLLSSSSVLRLMVEALRWLDNDIDIVATFYLRSHLADIALWDTFTAEANSLRQMPLVDLVEQLYRMFGLDLVEGQDAYVLAFLDAVLDFVNGGHADLHSFVAYWDDKLSSQSIPATSRDGIRIITIHKAKGLEFNTVLLPFCSWPFERPGRSASDLLWTSPTEAPYDAFSLLPISPTQALASNSVFADEYAEERLNRRLDELNALYVALTRARANLFIWSVGRETPDDIKSVGTLVATTLPMMPEMVQDESNDEKGSITYTFGEPCLVSKHSDAATRMEPVHTSINVRMQSYDARLPFRQSNRSEIFFEVHDGDAERQADSELLRRSHNIEFGQLMHSVLQDIATIDDMPRVLDSYEREGVISRTSPDGTFVSIRRSDLENRLRKAFDDPTVASWYAAGTRLFTECSIVCRNDDGTARTLRPDRVVMSDDGRVITVIDYKTGSPHTSHREQVETYMELLHNMYPSATIKGYLWYVISGEVSSVGEAQC